MTTSILAINLGGTSTKVGYSKDNHLIFNENIEYTLSDLNQYSGIFDQKQRRLEDILALLKEKNIDVEKLSAVVSRAGILPPINAGAYEINADMVAYSREYVPIQHASNLGSELAIALIDLNKVGGKAYIYDGESLDQLAPIARFTGVKSIPKQSIGHLMNMRAVSRVIAERLGKEPNELNFVIAHMGGGTSVGASEKGKIIDVLADDEGPFSVERSGAIALKHIINLCYAKPKEEVNKILRKEGGLYSYLGTNDGRQIEKRIKDGDEYAALVYEALAYQVSKSIGDMAVALKGKVDGIILTGGLANSEMVTDWIEKWCGFIGKIYLVPNEYEMESMMSGIYRVLKEGEKVNTFSLSDYENL